MLPPIRFLSYVLKYWHSFFTLHFTEAVGRIYHAGRNHVNMPKEVWDTLPRVNQKFIR